MKLTDAMHAATDGTTTDLDLLARASRRQGARLRRRRRALTGAAALATVAAAAGTTWLATPGAPVAGDAAVAGSGETGGMDSTTASATPSAPPTPEAPRSPTALVGRATAAGLQAAVDQVADGTFSGWGGQGGRRQAFGELTFEPADGSGAGLVQVNVQHGYGDELTCSVRELVDGGVELVPLPDCTLLTLPSGDRVRTYTDTDDVATGQTRRLVVDRVTADDSLRVVASATSGGATDGESGEPTRDSTVLDADQLRTVVTQDWWTLPPSQELLDLGAGLATYRDYDLSQPKPTPLP